MRLWEKVRAHRPTICQLPELPLIDRLRGSRQHPAEALLGAGRLAIWDAAGHPDKLHTLSLSQLKSIFGQLAGRLPGNPGMADLHEAVFSPFQGSIAIDRSHPDNYYYSPRGTLPVMGSLTSQLAHLLFCRNLFISVGMDPQESTLFVEEHADLLLHHVHQFQSPSPDTTDSVSIRLLVECLANILNYFRPKLLETWGVPFDVQACTIPEALRYLREPKRLAEAIHPTLAHTRLGDHISHMVSDYANTPVSQSIDHDARIDLSPSVLEELHRRVGEALERPIRPFHYPAFRHFANRLVAILGPTPAESYFQSVERGYAVMRNMETTESPKDLSPAHVAVIYMYPWEADHILKAEEIARRGLSVTEPLGRLFLGELEFALFKWVPGNDLLTDLDSHAHGFGQMVRDCVDKGIFCMDAAPRNVILHDGRLHMIDFEHTVLMEQQPLAPPEVRLLQKRLMRELSNSDPVMTRFEQGFGHSIFGSF